MGHVVVKPVEPTYWIEYGAPMERFYEALFLCEEHCPNSSFQPVRLLSTESKRHWTCDECWESSLARLRRRRVLRNP